MTTLLVLTVGQSDVQVVTDGVRRELGRDDCAALHDEIERRGYVLGDAPVQKGRSVATLPEGELCLCTPKLDAVLRTRLPAAALVLETCRDAGSSPGDPRFAGAVLAARLKNKGVETVYRRAYLQGTERLEDRDERRDAVIRREVVNRLEQAVRDIVEAAKPSRIVVAPAGGFPVVSDLVEEIVRLHASVPVEALEVADGAKASPPTADRAVPRMSTPEPLVSFQARRRAIELVERGNLLGAWAVAEPLHGDEFERRWTRVVEWLEKFASSMPMPEGCDIPVLAHKRMAARAALRVELALRAGDIPRAVHGTVAFWEAALWDRLLERFDRDQREPRFLELRGDAVEPSSQLLRGPGFDEHENKRRPFERQERNDGRQWFWFYESGAGRFTKYYLKSDTLKALTDAVIKVKTLRNDVAHGEPTPARMESARCTMRDAGLWSEQDRFLTQEVVRKVLVELGVPEPHNLYEDLIATVRDRWRGGGMGNPRSASPTA